MERDFSPIRQRADSMTKIKKKYFLLPLLMILIIVTAEYTINSGFISSFIKSPSSSQTLSTSTQDFRPQHCEDKDCVDSRVFQFLPNMPQDFSKVINSLNLNLPENFSKTFVDESYYKQ